jgi:hypothetical protein
MEPTPVTLDEATARRLTAANGQPVPLCDPTGEVIGYYFTPARKAEAEKDHRAIYAELDRRWPPEEIARIIERSKNDPRPNIPHEEVIRWVEGQ